MNLDIIKTALLTVGVPVSRYFASETPNKYIVWAEDGQSDALWAENRMQNQAIQGTIDYFTKSSNDANFDKIQNALNDAGVVFRLNSVQYETDTKFLHYEWTWEIWHG